jgi:hypothetical protein
VVRLYTGTGPSRRYLDDACRPEGAHGLRAVGPPLDASVDGSDLRPNPYGETDREPPIPVGCLRIVCSESPRWKQGSTGPGARGGVATARHGEMTEEYECAWSSSSRIKCPGSPVASDCLVWSRRPLAREPRCSQIRKHRRASRRRMRLAKRQEALTRGGASV